MTATSYHDQHIAEWRDAADELAAGVFHYTNAIFEVVLPDITLECYGRLTSVNRAAGTVGVSLEAPGGQGGATTAQFGLPAPAPSDVGKRARIWKRLHFTYPREGPPTFTTRFFLDTILGGQ